MVQEDNSINACNTDGAGLKRDLCERYKLRLSGTRILILGAGGAARGIVLSLLNERPAILFIANRTVRRAVNLVSDFASLDQDDVLMSGSLADALNFAPFDLVIDATSAGHEGGISLPSGLCCLATTAYSLSYGKAASVFLHCAASSGVGRAVDGLGMLVEQAALSFAYWEQKMPSTEPVYLVLQSEK